jgi:hypothetical protein
MCFDEEAVSGQSVPRSFVALIETSSLGYNFVYRVIPIETGYRGLLLIELR